MKTLKGHLEHFGLAEVLQTLAASGHTGTLVVQNAGEKKSIAFNIGSIAFVNSPGSPSGISLGQILIREGKITLPDLEQARIDQEKSGQLIGRALLDRGKITFEDLQDALRKKIEEELYDLFLWDQGDFEFIPGDGIESELFPMHRHTQVQVDPQSVVLEGLRQLDESRIISERIPDPRHVPVVFPSGLPAEISLDVTEAAVWELIDGNRSVEEIQSLAPDTRFRVKSAIFRFIEEKWVRLLSAEEMLERARQLFKCRDHQRAGDLYLALRDSTETLGNDPDFLLEAADALGHRRPEDATESLVRAATSFRLRGDFAGAWSVSQRLRRLCPGDPDILLLSWNLREAAPSKRLKNLFEDVIGALRRADRNLEALAVFQEAESTHQGEAGYWLDRSEIERRLQKPQEAAAALRRSMEIAESRKDSENLLKAASALHTIEPGTPGIQERIADLKEKNEDRDRIRRLVGNAARLTLAGCILALIFWGWAEWRAQVQLTVALFLAENATLIEEKTRAAEGFEALSQQYPLTLAGLDSARRGEKLRNDLRIETERTRKTEEEKFARAHRTRREILESTRVGLAKVEELLGQNRFIQARAVALSVAEGARGASLPVVERAKIYIPTRLASIPTGARVFAGTTLIGETPLVLRLPADGKVVLQLERSGCESRQVSVNSSAPLFEIELEPHPLSSGTLPSTHDGQILALGGAVVISCRDGRCYVIDPQQEKVDDYLAVLSGGLHGHPGALLAAQGNSLLVAPLAGPVSEVNSRDWSLRWSWSPEAPVTAACAFGGGWAIADENGSVHFLDHRGRVLSRYEARVAISMMIVDGDSLVVLDRSLQLHRLDRGCRLGNQPQRLPGPCHALLPRGGALLSDGRFCHENRITDGPVPLTGIGLLGDRFFYGVEGGWVLAGPTGTVLELLPADPTCAPLPCDAGFWIACSDARIRLVDLEGEVKLSLPVEGTVRSLLAIEEGRIIAVFEDGRVSVHEGVR